MSYAGSGGNSLLVSYSEQGRARIGKNPDYQFKKEEKEDESTDDDDSESEEEEVPVKKTKQNVSASTKGKLAVRVSGYSVQYFTAAELVQQLSVSKLKAAAKKVLKLKGVRPTRKAYRRKKLKQHERDQRTETENVSAGAAV